MADQPERGARFGIDYGKGERVTGVGEGLAEESPGRLSDAECFTRAKTRGQATFTLVAQDLTSPTVICEWIKQNIETCGRAKLFEALSRAIEMRDQPRRKAAD